MAQPKEGSIVHVEIHSSDPGRTKEFYAETFGWEFRDMPEQDYILWKAADEPAGGLQKHGDKGPMVLNYLLSENIERTLQRIASAGGTVLEKKTEIPGQGWWALFREPGGTVMALYQTLGAPQPARKPPTKKAAKGKGAKGKAAKGRKKK